MITIDFSLTAQPMAEYSSPYPRPKPSGLSICNIDMELQQYHPGTGLDYQRIKVNLLLIGHGKQ